MGLHWDGTISLGNIITLLFGAGPILFFVVRIYVLFREFPPHRHMNGDIYYPKGMKPEDAQRTRH
jgi:hypothetical protein